MTHFIKLTKPWEENKKGDVVEVGKSTAHALIMDKKGVRTPDPAKFPPSTKEKPKKKKAKKNWSF